MSTDLPDFSSLKTEWIPEIGYSSFDEANRHIKEYIIGYYSQIRPHTHNNGLAPRLMEQRYWNAQKNRGQKNLSITKGMMSVPRLLRQPSKEGVVKAGRK